MVEDLLTKSKKILLTATQRPADRLYYLDVPRSRSESAYPAYALPTSKLEKLHRKLGHLNYSSIRSLVRKDLVTGIALTKEELEIEPPVCAACMMGKITRASFPPSESGRASQFLALIHSDLWGPAPVQSISGSRYMITFTDDFSRWVWIFFLRRKSDAFAVFKQWKVQVEKESGKSIRIFRTDNGSEYFSNVWTSYMKDEGIRWETTTPRTPEQNGVSERLNRSIVDRVRTILIDAGLPLHLWTEAVNYIVYTKNRSPTHAIPITPFEKRYNRKPDISRLHRFGCVAFVLDDAPGRHKLDPKGKHALFVGYPETQKGWRVYHPSKRQIQVSANVKFDDDADLRDSFLAEGEYQFSYKSLKSSISRGGDPEENSSQEPVSPAPVPPAVVPPIQPPPHPQSRPVRPAPQPRAPSSRTAAAEARMKIAKASARLQKDSDEDTNSSSEDEADIPAIDDVNDERVNIASGEEPKTYHQAISSPDRSEWESAMESELDSIAQLGTYQLVELPPGREAIDTKWVYRIKHDTAGNIIRYKARLVARGFTQKPGVDFDETFAPVAKIESIRLLCAIAAALDWEIHVIDIDSAFLNSEMPKDQPAYVKQPTGYEAEGKEYLVWLLLKALYSLRQSGYLWYNKLKSILTTIGFRVSLADPCVFYRTRTNGTSIIASHVDDLGLYCSSIPEIQCLKDEISKHVSFKDQGEISHILQVGIEVIRDRRMRTISFSHCCYIDSMLKTYGLEDANPVCTPATTGVNLSLADCPKSAEESQCMRNVPYQNAVGALNHCAVMTRPDISLAVQKVAQFAANPGHNHWLAVKRIFRYLKGTRNTVLTIGGKLDVPKFHAYCDSDFANSPDHGRSVSGYAIMLGCGVFSWSAKKQTATALSTSEAEYYAAVHAGREILWLRELTTEIDFVPHGPTVPHMDNTPTIRIITKPDEVTHRTKYIRIAYHWIRDCLGLHERADVS
jgi:transposase InsO family protein